MVSAPKNTTKDAEGESATRDDLQPYDDVSGDFDSFADVINSGVPVVNSRDALGDGYRLIPDKDLLVKVPFVIVSYVFNVEEDTKRVFVTMRVLTKNDEKWIVNDGGTGILAQMQEASDRALPLPIYVEGGLRKSTYNHPQHGKSTTFYLD